MERQWSALVTSAWKTLASPPSVGDQLEGLLRVIGVDIHEQDLRAFTGEQDTDAALPLPTPGPLEPAPVTMATFPSSRPGRSLTLNLQTASYQSSVTNTLCRTLPSTALLMCPWPVVSSARQNLAGADHLACPIAHLDLHRCIQVDDELPPRRRMEVEVVISRSLPKDHPRSRNPLRHAPNRRVMQLVLNLLKMRLPVLPRKQPSYLQRVTSKLPTGEWACGDGRWYRVLVEFVGRASRQEDLQHAAGG